MEDRSVFYIIFIFYLLRGCKGGGQTWKYWELSRIGMHDVKLPKNQYKNCADYNASGSNKMIPIKTRQCS